MTAIVAIVEDGVVYMGADSAASNGSFIFEVQDCKIFNVRDFMIGYTTSFRMGQILEYCFNPPEQTSSQDTLQYMVSSFVPSLMDTFEHYGFLSPGPPKNGGNFLVGYRGDLFEIQNDFSVLRSANGYAAVGSGQDYCYSSLFTSLDFDISPVDRLELALSSASHFSTTVQGPFHISSMEFPG